MPDRRTTLRLIREALEAQGRTQNWLAEETGVSIYRTSRYLDGISRAPDAWVRLALRRLGLPPSLLFFDGDVPDGTETDPSDTDSEPSSAERQRRTA